MSITATITGDVLLLRHMLNNDTPTNLECRLFNNNHTPAPTDSWSNFTETTASNYSAIALLGSNWTVSSGVSAGATATYATQSFNFSAADNIYGYVVCTPGKGSILWGEMFAGAPFTLPSSGGTIQLGLKISLT